MDLIIQSSAGGSLFYVDIGYFDTALEIKEKIQKRQGIPVSQQTLIFNGSILPDNLNVHDSDILDRSRIHLVIAASDAMETNQNFLLPTPKLRLLLDKPEPESEPASVEVEIAETIRRLKEKIHEVAGTPTERIVIHAYGNYKLPDEKTILEVGLCENSEVTVDFLPDPLAALPPRPRSANMGQLMKLRFFVRNGEEKVAAEMSAAESVGALRQKLQEMKMRLPEEGYFFTFKQNVMHEDKSLGWHEVGQGDTIEIFRGTVSSESP